MDIFHCEIILDIFPTDKLSKGYFPSTGKCIYILGQRVDPPLAQNVIFPINECHVISGKLKTNLRWQKESLRGAKVNELSEKANHQNKKSTFTKR